MSKPDRVFLVLEIAGMKQYCTMMTCMETRSLGNLLFTKNKTKQKKKMLLITTATQVYFSILRQSN